MLGENESIQIGRLIEMFPDSRESLFSFCTFLWFFERQRHSFGEGDSS